MSEPAAPPAPTGRSYLIEPWTSPDVRLPRPALPPPAAGELVWVHEEGDVIGGEPRWRVGWRWAAGPDGWTPRTDGLLAYEQAPPAGCGWLPPGWCARAFPLGLTPAHVAAWGRYVRGVFETDHGDLRPSDLERGWLTLARTTRLLARHLGVIGQESLAAALPASRDEAWRSVGPLLDSMLDAVARPATPSPPPPPGEPAPDGPFDPDGFRFGGVEVHFGRAALQRRLVLALWDAENRRPRPARPIVDVLDEVYGDGHRKKDSTFRQLCADTNTRLEATNLPLRVRNLQASVQLTPRPA